MNQRKLGVLLSYAAQGIQILSGLIYTPLMLRLLGKSEYGLYQLVYSVVSYLSLLSLGFGSSYMRFYAREKAKQNETEIARLNGLFMTIFLVISGICILCGCVMLGNIEAIFGNGLTESEYGTARILMVLMIFNLAVTFPTSIFDSIVTAHEQFIFQKVILVLQYLLNPFLTLPILLMGYGSVGMVTVTTVLTMLKFVVNGWFCLKKLHVRFLFRGFRLEKLKQMWVFTFFIFLNQIIDQVNWSVDKFLLGRMMGTTAVAVYGLAGQINTMYMQFSTAISNVFIPQVNRYVAEEKGDEKLTDLFIRVGRIQFILLALIISGYILFGRTFIAYWGGEGYEDSYGIGVILMLPVTVPLIQNLGIEIQRAKNLHRVRSVVYLCIALGNIGLSCILIQVWGAKGAALGTAIALILGNIIFMNLYYQRRIGLDMVQFWKEIGSFVPALFCSVLLGTVTERTLRRFGMIGFVAGILIYCGIYACFVWKLALNDYEKELARGALCKFRRK